MRSAPCAAGTALRSWRSGKGPGALAVVALGRPPCRRTARVSGKGRKAHPALRPAGLAGSSPRAARRAGAPRGLFEFSGSGGRPAPRSPLAAARRLPACAGAPRGNASQVANILRVGGKPERVVERGERIGVAAHLDQGRAAADHGIDVAGGPG